MVNPVEHLVRTQSRKLTWHEAALTTCTMMRIHVQLQRTTPFVWVLFWSLNKRHRMKSLVQCMKAYPFFFSFSFSFSFLYLKPKTKENKNNEGLPLIRKHGGILRVCARMHVCVWLCARCEHVCASLIKRLCICASTGIRRCALASMRVRARRSLAMILMRALFYTLSVKFISNPKMRIRRRGRKLFAVGPSVAPDNAAVPPKEVAGGCIDGTGVCKGGGNIDDGVYSGDGDGVNNGCCRDSVG